MRIRLFTRLLLAFSGVAVAALLVAAGVWRWQFSTGFLDYMNRAEQAEVERVASALANAYAREAARRVDPDWRQLWRGTPRFGGGDGRPRRNDGRPPRNGPGRRDRGAPTAAPPVRAEPPASPASPAPPAPPRPGRDPLELDRRVALFDSEGLRIIGPRLPPGPWEEQPVVVAGDTVAVLRRAVLTEVGAGPGQTFVSQQNRFLASSFLAVAVLTTLFAWFFARRLVAPVHTIADGTRRLAAGDFDTRIDVTRTDELGDLARDFDDLARQLADAEAARQRWMADIAHELRTPLTVLQGEIEALVDGVREPDPERLRALESEVACLTRLVGDLRTLTLSDRGALDYRFEQIDLAAVVRHAVDGFRAGATEADLSLSFEPPGRPCWIRGDADRLLQLCNNLLGNSLRHTDPGGEILVHLGRSPTGLRLAIEDSKPAVPHDELELLGTPLYRAARDRGRDSGGSGLGLAICMRIADAHDARMTFAAADLGGLAVTVEFPANA
ncbi:MAG: ATP-binding protein [Pseudomonadota bacterium]